MRIPAGSQAAENLELYVNEKTLIKKVLVNRTKVFLGESFRVVVKTVADTPTIVTINGLVGHDQYLQFSDYTGTRQIVVISYAEDGRADRRSLYIDVLDAPECLKLPIIDVAKDYSAPYLISCSVRNHDALNLHAAFYEWNIGTSTTFADVPNVHVSLVDQLRSDALYQTFCAALTIRLPDETALRALRSFTLFNDYAFAKQFRRHVLPIVEYDFVATRTADRLLASVVVRNIEDVSLFLTHRQIEYLYSDPDKLSVPGDVHQIDIVVIEPRSRREMDCSIAFREYPSDAWGYAVHYHGRTDNGYEVHASAYFEHLTNHQIVRIPKHPRLVAALNELRSEACTAQRHRFTIEEVSRHLQQRNVVLDRPISAAGRTRGRAAIDKTQVQAAHLNLMDFTEEMMHMHTPVHEGDQCLPDQEPPSEEWVCQLTDEWAWVFVPSRIMNARKGDVVLSPSGLKGPVSLVLHSVNPPQHYAHTGLMVQNFYTLRHSTASDDWLQDEDFLAGEAITGDKGTDGLDPDRLKYIWPGTVTQSVQEAFTGSWLPDPEGHKDDKGNVKMWKIQAFDFYPKDNGNNLIVEPLVVKPNPMVEAELPKVREVLHEVAEQAKRINGHYRLFCFTNSAIVFDDRYAAPARANWWGSGTLPTMCSNFIWAAVQRLERHKAQLEGPERITRHADLEPSDAAPTAGAEVDNKTRDGLYFYDEYERRYAAKELYRMYYDIANEKTWWRFGNDAPDDVASQVCNTFAFDWTGENADGVHAKDSDDYENPGDGRAVSPANILLWDAPRLEGDRWLGLYGFSEKLIYRPARLEWRQVSRWKKVAVNGKLNGQVMRRGVPQGGAFVTAGGKEAITGADGKFSLVVRAGRYASESRILADGFMWEGRSAVDVPAGGIVSTVIELKEPPDWFREVTVFGTMELKDEEFGDDEFETRTRLFRVFRIGAFFTHEEDGWTEKMGGEVRAELTMRLDWQMDLSVHVFCTLKLFEGTSEDTSDLDGQNSQLFIIERDVIDKPCAMFVRNDDEDDDDHVNLVLRISNRRQP